MSAFQVLKELEEKKRLLVEAKMVFDAKMREARLGKGTTRAMREEACAMQAQIEAVNKEIAHSKNRVVEKGMGSDLLPCPFCGALAALTNQPDRKSLPIEGVQRKLWYVICTNFSCGCSLKKKWSPTEAIRVWQDRKA